MVSKSIYHFVLVDRGTKTEMYPWKVMHIIGG